MNGPCVHVRPASDIDLLEPRQTLGVGLGRGIYDIHGLTCIFRCNADELVAHPEGQKPHTLSIGMQVSRPYSTAQAFTVLQGGNCGMQAPHPLF